MVYFFHWPGMVYAGNWYTANNTTEAKKQIREYFGFKRLPNGFAIWEAK